MSKKFFGLMMAALVMIGTPAFAKNDSKSDNKDCKRVECMKDAKCDSPCKEKGPKCDKKHMEKANKFCTELNLTEEQKAKIKEIKENERKDMENIRTKYNAEMKKILSSDQYEKFEKMKERKFKDHKDRVAKGPRDFKKDGNKDKMKKDKKGKKSDRSEKK